MEGQILSRKQASSLLSVSTKTIDRWIRLGYIRAFKPKNSNRVLIHKDSLTEDNLKAFKPNFKNEF